EHDMPQDEPLVRLYRGISPLNGALIAHQVPSILKKIPALGAKPFLSSGGFKVEHEATLAAAEAFAENPSYDNMMALVRVTHDEPDRYFIDHRIDRIQQNMLRRPDLSLVDCLRREHIASPAGSPYSGADLSPFMATANTPEFAAGFGDTLMVL